MIGAPCSGADTFVKIKVIIYKINMCKICAMLGCGHSCKNKGKICKKLCVKGHT